MDFAEYLFREKTAEQIDQFEQPADGRRPASDAALLKIDDGETVTDKPERRIRILVDLPELTLTWTRYVEGEEGPARTSTSSTWIPSSSIPRS
jgi:hypothetical protein